MYLRKLQPIRDKDSYSKQLEKLLAYDLFHLIYKPLIDLLDTSSSRENEAGRVQYRGYTFKLYREDSFKQWHIFRDSDLTEPVDGASTVDRCKNLVDGWVGYQKENAKPSVLIQAFLKRIIYFNEGFVYGKFNASISKALRDLGGTFNNTKKAFKIALGQFPPEVRDALARGSAMEQEAVDKMRKKLQELEKQAIVIPGADNIAGDTLDDLHKQFKKLTPADLEIPVEIPVEMHEARAKQIKDDYTDNIHLEINNLSQESIAALRQKVEEEVGMGTRAEKLKEILFSQYGVAANRAKFIARQETSLFVAKYREVRYTEAGVNKYQWSTSSDKRVRHDHKELNGRIFSFDSPPITDKATGARNNPGEDFGCRCVALPVIMQGGKNLLEVS